MTQSGTMAAVPWKPIFLMAAVPAAVAVLQLGRIHPDEVYQTLEPAYFRAFGYGVLSWEWSAGIRNWAIPLALSTLLKLSAAIGISNPRLYRAVLEIPQYMLHAWMLSSVFRYARRRVEAGPALWATLAVALYGPVITFAGRTLAESFSTAFLIIAIEALDDPNPPTRRSLLAGMALGFSVLARYGSLPLVLAALVWVASRRSWRALLFSGLGGLAIAGILGALDWLTWGNPFHSLLAYLEFNVLSGRAAAEFGSAPASYYLPVIARSAPLWAWIGIPLALWKERPRLSLPLFCALVYALAISAVLHKEERFCYPALVLLAVAAAPGLTRALQLAAAPALRAPLSAVAVATNALGLAYPGELHAQRGDQFRAIVRAARPPDATGLLIVNEGLWGAGGFFYLGKNIPWLTCDWPQDYNFRLAMDDPRFNRSVSYDGRAIPELQAAGFRVIDAIGRATILRRP
jgi:hypothetical protein